MLFRVSRGFLTALILGACTSTIVVRDPCPDLRYIETRDAIVRGSVLWEAADKAALVTEYRDILTVGTAQEIRAHNAWVERICDPEARPD